MAFWKEDSAHFGNILCLVLRFVPNCMCLWDIKSVPQILVITALWKAPCHTSPESTNQGQQQSISRLSEGTCVKTRLPRALWKTDSKWHSCICVSVHSKYSRNDYILPPNDLLFDTYVVRSAVLHRGLDEEGLERPCKQREKLWHGAGAIQTTGGQHPTTRAWGDPHSLALSAVLPRPSLYILRAQELQR